MPRSPTQARTSIALIALLAFAQPVVAQTAFFHGLGFLDASRPDTVPLGVSADGNVVVGTEYFVISYAGAFRWTPETGMLPLPFAGATAVSEDGVAVAGYARTSLTAPTYEATRWTQAEGTVLLGYLPGGNSSYATGISADGAVIVGISNSTRAPQYGELFRWTAESGMEALGTLSGSDDQGIECYGISADGTTVIGAGPPSNSTKSEAFYWNDQTGIVGIGYGITHSNGAYACSADGSVIVGAGTDGQKSRPFRWTANGGIIDLTHTCGTCYDSTATCVSSDGDMIGGDSVDLANPDYAAIWEPQRSWRFVSDVLRNDFGITDVSGWYLEKVYSISPDGQILIGTGYDPDFYAQGWIAFIPRPAPCPSDVNGDRTIDLSDIAQLLSAFGAVASNPPYSLACDLDRNGLIDLADLATVLAAFGDHCP